MNQAQPPFLRNVRIDVEPWAPEFGSPIESEALTPTDAQVDVSVEVAAAAWRPLDAAHDIPPADCVDFVDGVRRIDARVWLTFADGSTRMGLCASFAAGRVRCAGTSAHVVTGEMRRGLFSTAGAPHLETKAGTWHAFAVASDDIDKLSQGVQERMADLERMVAAAAAREEHALLVVDGPLTGKLDLVGAVGYVKTHRVAYLPPEVSTVIGQLAAGQRTPLFVTQGTWSRYNWYLRLPGPGAHAWSGVVRCEASADLSLDTARHLADTTARTLPRFASSPHKDPRAPQNLYPIAGLERELRRRLGDATWLWRAIKSGASLKT
jgi:hypothetical protein